MDYLEINLEELIRRNWDYTLLFLGIIICSISIGFLTKSEFGWLVLGGSLISWAVGRLFRKRL